MFYVTFTTSDYQNWVAIFLGRGEITYFTKSKYFVGHRNKKCWETRWLYKITFFRFSIVKKDHLQQDRNRRVRLVQAGQTELGQTKSNQPTSRLFVLRLQIRQYHVLHGISTQTQGQQFRWFFFPDRGFTATDKKVKFRICWTGVTCNCLHPGLIDSGIWRNVPFPLNLGMQLIVKSMFKVCVVWGNLVYKRREAHCSACNQRSTKVRGKNGYFHLYIIFAIIILYL